MLSSEEEDIKAGDFQKDFIRMKVCHISSQLLITLSNCMPEEHPSKCSGWTDHMEQP